MANKKVKRWKSRPAGKKGDKYGTFPGPRESEVYKIRSDTPRKQEQQGEAESVEQRKKTNPKRKPVKKRKYKSVPASKKNTYAYATHSDKERLHRERMARKKRNNLIVRVAVASVFLVVAAVISIFVFFKIGQIKVVGSKKYTAAQVIEASGIELGDNLFAPSAKSVQNKMDTALPYVQRVVLKHQLPDVLIINIRESTAQFAFEISNKTQKRYILTDADLKLLEVAQKPPAGAAIVEGVGIKDADMGETAKFKEPEKGELVTHIKKVFADNGLDNVTRIDVKNIIDINVSYNDAITVQIGQANELDYKCKLAAKAIGDALKENKKAGGTVNVKQADQTKQAYYNPK